jgi:hypothetical protein
MKQNIDTGRVGKICVDEFSMKQEIERREQFRQQPVENNGVIIDETKGKTVWRGE